MAKTAFDILLTLRLSRSRCHGGFNPRVLCASTCHARWPSFPYLRKHSGVNEEKRSKNDELFQKSSIKNLTDSYIIKVLGCFAPYLLCMCATHTACVQHIQQVQRCFNPLIGKPSKQTRPLSQIRGTQISHPLFGSLYSQGMVLHRGPCLSCRCLSLIIDTSMSRDLISISRPGWMPSHGN